MKIHWTTLAIFALTQHAAHLYAQQSAELVYNGSFEQHTRCPERIDALGIMTGVDAWWQPTQGSSDYFNSCGSRDCSVPRNKMGSRQAFSGQAYCGIYCSQEHYREYLQTELAHPLEAGRRYRVSFAACLAEKSPHAVATIGALLTPHPLNDTSSGILMKKETIGLGGGVTQSVAVPCSPQVENGYDNVIDDGSGWIVVSGEFNAAGGERFLTIGNFRPFNKSHVVPAAEGNRQLPGAYYYIDNVSVTPADTATDPSIAEPPAAEPAEGDIVELKGILFATGKSEVLPQSYNTLRGLMELLATHPSMKIELRGHTDNQGTAEFNQKLSKERAEAVATYLTSHGIDPARIVLITGFGESMPVDDNDSPEGRSHNRRVEYRVARVH